MLDDRLAAEEPARLADPHREAEPRVVDRVGVVDVVPVVAVALLQPQAAQRLQPDRSRTGGDEAVVHVGGVLGGQVELVPQLPHVGDPETERPRQPHVDLPRRAERERRRRQVAGRQRLQQLARARPLQAEQGERRRHVGHGRRPAGQVPPDPRLDMPVHGVGRHDEVPLLVELRHREVRLDGSALVQPGRVGHAPARPVDGVRREPRQQRTGVRPLHEELRHEGHVEHPDGRPDGAVLGGPVPEPPRPAPGQRVLGFVRPTRTSPRPPNR